MLHFQSPPSPICQKLQSTNPLPGSPAGPIWRELPVSRAFVYVSLGVLSKSCPDRKFSHFCQSPWERCVPSMFPKMEPLWKLMPVSRALPNTSFRVPSKGALFHVPTKELTQREMLHFQVPPSSVCQSPWSLTPPSRFPNGASMECDAHLQSLFHILQISQ